MNSLTKVLLVTFLCVGCQHKQIGVDKSFLGAVENPLTWSCKKLPLKLSIHRSISKEYKESIIEAVAYIEKKVGLKLFTFVSRYSEGRPENQFVVEAGHVAIVSEKLKDNYLATTNFHFRLGKISSILVKFSDDVQHPVKVAVHELLHCLGLAHDGFKESILYPIIVDEKQDITERDVCVLSSTYKCGGQ